MNHHSKRSRYRIPFTSGGLSVLLITLALAATVAANDVISVTTSPSKKLRVELRGSGNPDTVCISPVANPDKCLLQFWEEHSLSVKAQVSPDDRLVVILYGGASYGIHPLVFVRVKNGTYRQQKIDLSALGWTAIARDQGIEHTPYPAHQRASIESIADDSSSIIFSMAGNYSKREQVDFGPIYMRYDVKAHTMTIIPKPPETEDAH